MLEVTRHVSLFSQPKPSPSGSLDALTQEGRPPLEEPGATAELSEPALEPELAELLFVTRHVSLFSQPKPSPSGSLAAERQAGQRELEPEFAPEFEAEPEPEFEGVIAPLTMQESLFSQP